MRTKLAILCAAALCASRADACSVPVFRYALERWPPAPYECVVFHRGPLPADAPGPLERMQQASEGSKSPANIALLPVDVAKLQEADDAARQLWEKHKAAAEKCQEPWLVVLYPRDMQMETPIYAGPLNESAVDRLLVSPVRVELAKRLLSGDSVVWLVIGSEDKAKDDAVAKLLDEQLKRLGKELKLPEIQAEDQRVLAAAQPPLKMAFSMLRMDRNDPREQLLVSLLLPAGVSKDVKGAGPVVVPVFGRGRGLALLPGKDLTAEMIEDMATFLVGECSCTRKADSRGLDILMSADWEGLITGQISLAEAFPKLTTPAALIEAKQALAVPSRTEPKTEQGSAAEPASAESAETDPPEAAAEPDPLVRNVSIAVGSAVALALIAVVVIQIATRNFIR